jgi:hypothetical protein
LVLRVAGFTGLLRLNADRLGLALARLGRLDYISYGAVLKTWERLFRDNYVVDNIACLKI